MASFAAFCLLGLFPNPGQNVYFITPPFFESVNITNPVNGKVSVIRNVNFDPSYKNVYVQSATLNGQTWTRNWVGHEFFSEGMTLELVLGSVESAWGTREEDLPPSMSMGSFEML
jgi:putative alpha-1,2-mannosidase